MTGLAKALSDDACPSCGNRTLVVREWRVVCTECEWTPGMEWLNSALGWRLNAYRRASADLLVAGGPAGSPIEVMRREQECSDLASEIADLHLLLDELVLV